MDHLHERLDALEQQVHTLTQHTHTVTRRLRWWRGLACGLAVAGILGWGLPLGLAREDARDKDKDQKGLAQRVAALEKLLTHFTREKNEIFITGANLHIVNGLDSTDCGDEAANPIPDCPNGLGNLIVGYNELRQDESLCEGSTEPFCTDMRTGSHNVVVGMHNNFSRFGGLVVGVRNEISGDFASVSGGGAMNIASGNGASVSGGNFNTASGSLASVIGGGQNTASGFRGVVSGGVLNTASGSNASVSGGVENLASGLTSSVSGGHNRTAEGENDWVAGNLLEDE
jgi:hypothetical protein